MGSKLAMASDGMSMRGQALTDAATVSRVQSQLIIDAPVESPLPIWANLLPMQMQSGSKMRWCFLSIHHRALRIARLGACIPDSGNKNVADRRGELGRAQESVGATSASFTLGVLRDISDPLPRTVFILGILGDI